MTDTTRVYQWGVLTVQPLVELLDTTVCLALTPPNQRGMVLEVPTDMLQPPHDSTPPDFYDTDHATLLTGETVFVKWRGKRSALVIHLTGLQIGHQDTVTPEDLTPIAPRDITLDERGPDWDTMDDTALRDALQRIRDAKVERAPTRTTATPRTAKPRTPTISILDALKGASPDG